MKESKQQKKESIKSNKEKKYSATVLNNQMKSKISTTY